MAITENMFDNLSAARFSNLDQCRKAIKHFLYNSELSTEDRKYYDDKICIVRDKNMKYCVKLARD